MQETLLDSTTPRFPPRVSIFYRKFLVSLGFPQVFIDNGKEQASSDETKTLSTSISFNKDSLG